MNKIKTIIQKEWAEVFKNRMVLFTVIFLPLVMTAIPLAIIYFTADVSSGVTEELEGATSEMPEQFNAFCPPEINQSECFQVFMVSQFMLMFMLIPMAIPVTISAYSIVGEKATRSLEPLLATPITTLELLIGKSLASLIPAVVATFGAFGIYAVGALILISNPSVVSAMLDARWLIAIFVVGPLMALMAVMVSVMVSSRVNDPRVAEQLSMVVIVPVMTAFFGQFSGLFIINRQFIIITAVVLLVLDVILSYLATKVFQRETILTRWK